MENYYKYLFSNSESFYDPVEIKKVIINRIEKEMIENKGKEENYTFIRDFYKILKEYFKKRKILTLKRNQLLSTKVKI